MLKKITNIGDCGITCDFGDEVNKNTNKDLILQMHGFAFPWHFVQ